MMMCSLHFRASWWLGHVGALLQSWDWLARQLPAWLGIHAIRGATRPQLWRVARLSTALPVGVLLIFRRAAMVLSHQL